MKFGVFMFPTDYAIQPAALGREVEARGFESLFFPEHTHIPTSRRSIPPTGGELGREYSHAHDPFVALGAVSAVTERLLLGTGICLVIQRDPIVLAKEVASLDFMSGGRVLFGVGGGWNKEEMEDHGTNPALRWHVLRERVEAMKAIWTQDEAEYRGEFVSFPPMWQWPKPVQKPHPPVIVGGDGPTTLARVVRYGDAWMPVARRADFSGRITELQRLADAAGRGPIPVYVCACPAKAEVVAAYVEQGVDRVVFTLPAVPADEALPLLDRMVAVMRHFA